MNRHLIAALLAALGPVGPIASAQPGTVTGRAVDGQGRPLAGAVIWVNPVITTGLHETWTDADGRYQATGLPPVGYRVMGWLETEYQGQRYCLRLGHPSASDYGSVNPAEGATPNLIWQLQGRIPDIEAYPDVGYFGGSVSVMDEMSVPARNLPVEVTLTPTGPLIDGSSGQPLTRRPNAEGYLLDIPVGVYTVRATLDGQPVRVGSSSSSLASEATLGFPPNGSCKGNSSSGVGRAYLYWGAGGAGYDQAAPQDGLLDVAAPHTTSADGMAGAWEGTIAFGSNTFYVRYVLRDTEYGQGFVAFAGELLECDALQCLQIGTVSGKRVPGALVNFTTTLT